jgi:hypothetical protein
MGDSEGGRIARVLAAEKQCAARVALAKARALVGVTPCFGVPCVAGPVAEGEGAQARSSHDGIVLDHVPSDSQYLAGKIDKCYSPRQLAEGCVPSSVYLARQMQCTLDNATNPLNPEARFSAYRGPFIPPVCPPIPAAALNANVPKLQGNNCPLPNKPWNPVLPG